MALTERRKKAHAVGEYMEVYWDGDPVAEYVYGHATEAEARAGLNGQQPGLGDGALTFRHRWARLGFPSMDCSDGCDRELYFYDQASPGAFRVTEVRRV